MHGHMNVTFPACLNISKTTPLIFYFVKYFQTGVQNSYLNNLLLK
jgi:hypothetical protein